MEVGRLIFIVNRGIIHQPGQPASRMDVKFEVTGFKEATVNEALAVVQSMNLKSAQMTSKILQASGVQPQTVETPKNGR